MISAIVLTKNEEKNIKRCLISLRFVDEIIVIDDMSTDSTAAIAKKMGAKVFFRSLNANFSGQRNFGLEKAKYDWILFVDADEEVPKNLADEILKLTDLNSRADNKINGYFLRRTDYFMGKWLKYGEIGKIRLLRLGRKNSGKWTRSVDEIWKISGRTFTTENHLLHYPHPDLNQFLTSINERSALNAREFFNQGQKNTFSDWLKPFFKFCQNYFFRLGFLDGLEGFVFCLLMSLHSFLVRAKLYLLIVNNEKKSL